MIKQALNAPHIANIMRTFVKDDAIKLLGKSTYNKWLKKLPADSIANSTRAWWSPNTSEEVQSIWNSLRARETDRLQRTQDVSDALMHRYGSGFEANLPRVNERLDTRGRLKGAVLEKTPRINYLRKFADRNKLVSRDELLRWNRTYKAGLDPKTLTSEWYVKPGDYWNESDDVAILRKAFLTPNESTFYYNGELIPADVDYLRAQLVRNIAAVPYTDRIRYAAARLVANELHHPLNAIMRRRSIYNAASDNTRKVLNRINGRNVLEDPIAARLVESANKHGRLHFNIRGEFKNGNNAAFFPEYNALAVHPRLTPDIGNHEDSHRRLYNMDAQKHAAIAGRLFRNIAAISRKNPEYSNLTDKLLNRPAEAHEAVTDYYRHKLFGTLNSRAANFKAMGLLNAAARLSEPEINRTISEIQNLTSNPSLQQALQQLAIDYDVPLSNGWY